MADAKFGSKDSRVWRDKIDKVHKEHNEERNEAGARTEMGHIRKRVIVHLRKTSPKMRGAKGKRPRKQSKVRRIGR